MEDEDLDTTLPANAPMLSASEDAEAVGTEEVAETEAEDLTEAEQSAEEAEQEPEFDEIEFEGQTYAVPKALKDGFLMQADYTRKTQEVADERRAVEAWGQELDQRQQAFAQQIEAQRAHFTDYARLASLDDALAQYQKVDWATYVEQDPTAAQQHRVRYDTIKDQRQALAAKVSRAEQERASTAQHSLARRIDETQDVLRRDIENWGPDLANQLTEYGMQLGYTQQELSALNTDARAVKVLHRAFQADQLLKEPKPGKRPASQAIKPLQTVTKKRSRPPASPTPSDTDSDEAWMKKRRAQLHKRS
ncbi:MAG: hypothetical protein MJA84_01745 [Firmicutes bacterium]|nr:hypothetical protein [Bacillota bacterium]